MKFLSAKEVQRKSVSRATGRPNAGAHSSLVFSTPVINTKGRKPAKHFSLVIGGKVAKEAGLHAGDNVDIQYNLEHQFGLITPVKDPEDGWMLSGSEENALGYRTLKLRFTWHKGHPSIPERGECGEISVTDTGIMFKFPKAMVFEGVDGDAKEGGKKDNQEMGREVAVTYGRRSTDTKSDGGLDCAPFGNMD